MSNKPNIHFPQKAFILIILSLFIISCGTSRFFNRSTNNDSQNSQEDSGDLITQQPSIIIATDEKLNNQEQLPETIDELGIEIVCTSSTPYDPYNGWREYFVNCGFLNNNVEPILAMNRINDDVNQDQMLTVSVKDFTDVNVFTTDGNTYEGRLFSFYNMGKIVIPPNYLITHSTYIYDNTYESCNYSLMCILFKLPETLTPEKIEIPDGLSINNYQTFIPLELTYEENMVDTFSVQSSNSNYSSPFSVQINPYLKATIDIPDIKKEELNNNVEKFVQVNLSVINDDLTQNQPLDFSLIIIDDFGNKLPVYIDGQNGLYQEKLSMLFAQPLGPGQEKIYSFLLLLDTNETKYIHITIMSETDMKQIDYEVPIQ